MVRHSETLSRCKLQADELVRDITRHRTEIQRLFCFPTDVLYPVGSCGTLKLVQLTGADEFNRNDFILIAAFISIYRVVGNAQTITKGNANNMIYSRRVVIP